MTDSSKAGADYAPAADSLATEPVPRGARCRFQPRFWPTLAAALLVPLFMSAGQWQWNKAAAKAQLQTDLDLRGAEPAFSLPITPVDAESLRYRKVIARGQFEPQFQILIDNRIAHGQAGFHVVTPLRLEGSETRVLVNRGWVPAAADRRTLPRFETPSGTVEVVGTAVAPATRFFTLGQEGTQTSTEWPSVWQNLDLARYGKAVRFPVQPIILQLAPESSVGGFARDWVRPDDRRQTNLGYALQWWSFAATTVALWLFLNFRKTT